MYKTILVPLDGSERAEAILPHVVALAQSNGAKVHLLQAVEPDLILDTPDVMSAPLNKTGFETRKREAAIYLAEKKATLLKRRIETETHVTQGKPVESIATVAQVEDVDLIAIVSHGRTGLGRTIYGSVAMGILQQADRPIFVIRALDR